ncbi:major histocompatibility complex class I-related gene protein-like [Labeo rohita]|uniref:major histocompatibility complex class I-related gene protein-like n=1 Tax=Labeo rohita TaxID=84645 RepID=UPI0021E2B61E|nr:major histocompatibility complex class I-related gene protein-like [Labeo rohita]
MRLFVLLLFGIHLTFAGKHSLKYFYLSVSGDDDEFTTVGLVDDRQFIYFDINTRKALPKAEWIMRQNQEADYLDRQTALMIHEHNWIKKHVWIKSAGVHTYQLIYGCEWNDRTGETNGFRQYGYDGEDFLFLDLKTEKWISSMEEGFNTQERCNNETVRLEYWKYYLKIECIEILKEFLQLEKSSLEKTGCEGRYASS